MTKPEESTVFIIAPVGQDAEAMAGILREQEIRSEVCGEPAECLKSIGTGAGALVLTEETLEMPGANELLAHLEAQPAWSELPLIILTSGGQSRLIGLLELASGAGSVTLLERPMSPATLLRSVQVALRSRQRQYQVRDLMAEQKRTEAVLRESEERFRNLADGTPVMIWVHDAEGGLRFVNRAWTEFFGMTLDQATGEDWHPLVHAEDLAGYLERFRKCHAEQRDFHAQARVRRPDGQWRWLESFGAPRFSGSGEYLGMAGSSVDITERKNAEAVLARDKEELERLVAQRTAKLKELVGELEHFSYTITHDMRAPLRGIQGFAEMMDEAYADGQVQDARRFLERIRTSGSRMDRLITDALNYNRAVRQELPLELVDLGTLLQGMVDSYPELQPARVHIELGPELPSVMGNEAGLTQCFSNLLGNAVKYVKPGEKAEIRIWAEVLAEPHERSRSEGQSPIAGVAGRTLGDRTGAGEDADTGAVWSGALAEGPPWVRIWVEDNGIGISESMKGRVFDMFSRGHNSYEGTGIGLALVRKVAHQMGARVGVESEEGRGSRFWIELQSGERTAKS